MVERTDLQSIPGTSQGYCWVVEEVVDATSSPDYGEQAVECCRTMRINGLCFSIIVMHVRRIGFKRIISIYYKIINVKSR